MSGCWEFLPAGRQGTQCFVGVPGFEPGLNPPEGLVLPLHYTPFRITCLPAGRFAITPLLNKVFLFNLFVNALLDFGHGLLGFFAQLNKLFIGKFS